MRGFSISPGNKTKHEISLWNEIGGHFEFVFPSVVVAQLRNNSESSLSYKSLLFWKQKDMLLSITMRCEKKK